MNEFNSFSRSVRQVLAPYGRDYALGALHSLAVRNMMSVALPDLTEGFYPIVRVHEMVTKDLEEVFYGRVEQERPGETREKLVMELIDHRVWEKEEVS